MTMIEKPDFNSLAHKITERLSLLLDGSSEISAELGDLVSRIQTAIEANDLEQQKTLVSDIHAWLGRNKETQENLANVFQMFFYYVYLRDEYLNGAAADELWWVEVSE